MSKLQSLLSVSLCVCVKSITSLKFVIVFVLHLRVQSSSQQNASRSLLLSVVQMVMPEKHFELFGNFAMSA